MQVTRNISWAMVGSIVALALNLLAMPVYVRVLGIEAYGVIGFFVLLQTLVQPFDFGFAATINREVARGRETGHQRRSASLLRTLGLLNAAVACTIAAVIAFNASWIAAYWLGESTLARDQLVQALGLMGISLACRLPIALYQGAIGGAHRLDLSAMLGLLINLAATSCSVAVLVWGLADLRAYFAVQALFALLHALVLRSTARRILAVGGAPLVFRDIRRVLRFSMWMTGVSIGGLLLMQIDKVMLSRLLPLDEFGAYMLAVVVVGALQVLVNPVANALLPVFTSLQARGDKQGLERAYRVGTILTATVLFALGFALALHAEAAMSIWLGESAVVPAVASLLPCIVGGSVLLAIMYFPYMLQLSAGQSKLAFLITVTLLVLMVPLVYLLTAQAGAMGGAIAWLVLGAAYLILGTWLTGSRIADFAGWRWLGRSVAVPLCLTAVPSLLGARAGDALGYTPVAILSVATLAALAAMLLGLLVGLGSDDRRWLRGFVGRSPSPGAD